MKVGALLIAIVAAWWVLGLRVPQEYGSVGASSVAAASDQIGPPSVPRLSGTTRFLPGYVVDAIQLAGSGTSGSRSSGGSSGSNGGSNGSSVPAADLDELDGEADEHSVDEDECPPEECVLDQ